MANGDREFREWHWLGEELGAYRNHIKEKVTELYRSDSEAQAPLRFYTAHDLSHCQAVEDLVHRLIPERKFEALRERERFYLLASAWLHDLGMLRSVADRVWGRGLSDAEIRRRHHETTKMFIENHPFDCGVAEPDKAFLANLCFYHRKREDLRQASGAMTVGNVEYTFRLLAAYLRLADALHVDLSRTPERDFILSLAYNIPPETKLHWIKSRLVSGIHVDARQHLITVQFQVPEEKDIERLELDFGWVQRKLQAVIRHVLDELRDELASVMFVLSTGGITYYLDVQSKSAPGVDQKTLTHLLTMVMNYDVLVWPSATRLSEMILVNLGELAGRQLRRGQPPLRLPPDDTVDRGQSIRHFLEVLERDVLGPRAGHLGLRALLDRCHTLCGQSSFDLEQFVREIDAEYQRQHARRDAIRSRTAEAELLPLPDPSRCCHVLLYGYSELVIKALCGLRDRLLKEERGLDPKEVYGSQLELKYSNRFRIFVCEGQAKTHTAERDRLLYHDGIAYALALRQHNFTNLVIIPDAVLSAVVDRHHLDLLLVGANGFDATTFRHSAGHGSVIYLLRTLAREKNLDPAPRIVLVASSDKYRRSPEVGPPDGHRAGPADAQPKDVDGYAFWAAAGEHARENIWLNRDERKRAELREHREHIQLFNPRDDTIPIALVDTVISDCGVHPIRSPAARQGISATDVETNENIERFLAVVRKAQTNGAATAGRSKPQPGQRTRAKPLAGRRQSR